MRLRWLSLLAALSLCVVGCYQPQPRSLPGAVLARHRIASEVWLIDVASGDPKLSIDLYDARLQGSVTRDGVLYSTNLASLSAYRLSDGQRVAQYVYEDGWLSPQLAVDDRHVYVLASPTSIEDSRPEIVALDRHRFTISWTLPVAEDTKFSTLR